MWAQPIAIAATAVAAITPSHCAAPTGASATPSVPPIASARPASHGPSHSASSTHHGASRRRSAWPITSAEAGRERDLRVAAIEPPASGELWFDYLADTGADDNAHFGYLQVQFDF